MWKSIDRIFDIITNGLSYYQITRTGHWSESERERIKSIASALTTKDEAPQLVAKFTKQARAVLELREQSAQLLGALKPDYESIITRENFILDTELQNLSVDTKLSILFTRIKATKSEIDRHVRATLGYRDEITEPNKVLLQELSDKFNTLLYYVKVFSSLSLSEKVSYFHNLINNLWVDLINKRKQIFELLNRNWPILLSSNLSSKSSDELQVDLITLELLCFGVYVQAFAQYYIMQQNSLVTEYYYDEDNQFDDDDDDRIERYNHYYRFAESDLSDFTNSTATDIFLGKMKQILVRVRDSELIQLRHRDVEQFAAAQIANLVEYKDVMESFPKSFVHGYPEALSPEGLLDFSSSNISTGTEPWMKGRKVSYAIQFVEENVDGATAHGRKSKISEWSPSHTLEHKANPTVKVYPDALNRTRVILRCFDENEKLTKIVAILKDPKQVTFRDIDRDLFDAAALSDLQLSLSQTKFFIANGANVSALLHHHQMALHKAVERNDHWKVVLELLSNDAAHAQNIVNAQDDQGRTPIYIAAEQGNFEIVHNLLDGHGANANISTSNMNHHQMTPLHIATYKGHANIVDVLVKKHDPASVDLNARTKEGFTALHLAVAYSREPIVRLLLADNRTEVNAKSYIRCACVPPCERYDFKNFDKITAILATSANVTALHMAYAIGSEMLVKLLLKKGADMRIRTSDGSNVMHFAALNNNADLIPPDKCSLSNSPNLYDLTPLYIAYAHNNPKVAQKLLNNCADVNVRLSNFRTMLHIAIQCTDANVALELLENGVSLKAKDSNGHEALQYATWLSNTTMAEILLSHQADANALDVDGEPLVQSVFLIPNDNFHYDDNVGMMITQFIAHNVSINAVDTRHRNTLLHLACAFECYFCVYSTFRDQPTLHIHASNAQHETALHVALRMGNDNSATYLLDMNVSVTTQGQYNWTALNYAIAGKLTNAQTRKFVEQFMPFTDECHNRANAYRVLAQNVLQAAQYGRYEVNEFYVKECAFLQEIFQDPTKNNPIDLKFLSKLAKYGDAHMLKALFPLKQRERFSGNDFRQLPIIEALKGCAVECADLTSPQCACVRSNNTSEVLQFLHENGFTLVPDKALRNFYPLSTNWNALNYTILGSLENRTILELLTQKAKFRLLSSKEEKVEIAFPELRGEHNQTLMHLTAQANKVDIAQFLLEKKVDLNALDRDGYSPLHVAARYGNLEMVKWLIENGANVSQIAHAQTPLTEAILNDGTAELFEYMWWHESVPWASEYEQACPLVIKATQLNKAEIVIQLCERIHLVYVLLGCQTDEYETPLHFAASKNNIRLVEYFITATVSTPDPPFHELHLYNVFMRTSANMTPLYYAVQFEGQLPMVKYLHSQKADIHTVYEDRAENLISLAISREKYDIAKYLISAGADVQKAGKSKRTPLHEAIKADQTDLIRMLIKEGACADCAKDLDEKTPLDYIFEHKKDAALQYFLFNYSHNGTTLMHLRALENESDSVQWLVERGADVNIPDSLKNTALHLSAEKGYLLVAKELVKSKCIDISIRNENNQTALDCAEANNQTDIVELLKHHSRMRRQIEHEPVSMSNSIPEYHNGAGIRHSSFLVSSACLIGHVVSVAFERISAHASKLMSCTFGSTNSNGNPSPRGITNAQSIHNPSDITSNIDLNSTLLLLDVLIRRYYSSERYTMQPTRVKQFAETRACALALVERFQEELSSFSVKNEHFDWFEFYRTVERFMISEQYVKIERLLRMTVRKFADRTQIEDEIAIMRMIDRVLIETLFTSESDNINKTELMLSNRISHNSRVDFVHSELEINKLGKSLICSN